MSKNKIKKVNFEMHFIFFFNYTPFTKTSLFCEFSNSSQIVHLAPQIYDLPFDGVKLHLLVHVLVPETINALALLPYILKLSPLDWSL